MARLFTEIARQGPLVVRQLRRNPRRTALTFIGLVIAFFLFTGLESLLYTMSNIVSGSSRDALLFTRASDPDYWRATIPASYADAIQTLPGVGARGAGASDSMALCHCETYVIARSGATKQPRSD